MPPALTPEEIRREKEAQKWIKSGFTDYENQRILENQRKESEKVKLEIERTRTQRDAAKRNIEDLYKKRKLEISLPDINFNDISNLKLWRDRFKDYIENSLKRMERLHLSSTNLGLLQRVDEFIDSNRVFFRGILIKHAEKAFSANIDLNYPIWKTHLLKKLSNDKLITVTSGSLVTGADQKISIGKFSVDIRTNMLEILGSINDYADAVKATRSDLGYGNKVGGKLATALWYNRLWQVGRGNLRLLRVSRKKNITKGKLYKDWGRDSKLARFYKDIMRTRLENMYDQAPFWVLLDSGAINYPADKGGYAKPEIVPTHFVTNAEQEILEYCNSRFNSEEKNEEEKRIEDELTAINANIYHLEEIESILSTLIEELDVGGQYNARIEVMMLKLNLAFSDAISRSRDSERLKQIVNTKIDLLANQIIAGSDIGKRLYLFSSGKGQVRKRTVQLQVDTALALKQGGFPESSENLISLAKKNVEELQKRLKTIQRGR